MHTEHSPEYHFFATNAIERILLAPWWQIEASPPLHAKLALARHAPETGLWTRQDAACRWGIPTETVLVRDFAGLEGWPHRRRNGAMGAALDGYGVVRTDPPCRSRLGDAVPDRELPRRRYTSIRTASA